jgi:glycosyltransferase involved in cell wall biosynthesis
MTRTSTKPRVTYLACGRNCAPWLSRCLTSLIRQRDTEWRAVVVDDASTDGSPEMIRELIDSDPRITLLFSEERRFGLRSRLEAAQVAMASGADVLVALDLDDWLLGRGVNSFLRRLYQDRTLWVTYGSSRRWRPERRVLRLRPKRNPARGYSDEEFEAGGLRRAPWLGRHLRTWRAGLMRRLDPTWLLGDQGEELTSCEDMALMLPMLEMAGPDRARFVRKALYAYNCHGGTIMNSRRGEQLRIEEMLRARSPAPRCLALD